MKRLGNQLIIPVIVLLMLISGCNYPGRSSEADQNIPTMAGDSEISGTETPTDQHLVNESTQTLVLTPQEITATSTIKPTLTQTMTPTVEEREPCTDLAEYIDDVTVPDGALFSPGSDFIKTWRLKNVGTCTWMDGYKLVFAGGNQMGGDSEVPLTEVVQQGEEIDISVSLTSPTSNGNFQGLWQLQNQFGEKFGLGTDGTKPFWVKINVAESMSGVDLGPPSWQDTFKSSANWYLLDTGNTRFSIKNGHLIMTAESPGMGDEWGLATHSAVKNFYLEASFKTGESCDGKDRYGVLLRAPNPNAGYVISFSCDGSYRIYIWDGENYLALEEWKKDSNINSGSDQTNRMGVYVNDDVIKVYANGFLLGEYQDDTFSSGKFGLLIGSAETSDMIVYVEDIAYWLLAN